jgi:hypothetical protein
MEYFFFIHFFSLFSSMMSSPVWPPQRLWPLLGILGLLSPSALAGIGPENVDFESEMGFILHLLSHNGLKVPDLFQKTA